MAVYIYNPVTKAANMEKFITLGSYKNVENKNLSEIRRMLISEKALTFTQRSCPFCNQIGAEVEESLSFSMYQKFLDSSKSKDDEKVS